MDRAAIDRLHRRYLPLRHEGVPFPVESVFVWYCLLSLQRDLRIGGDLLELGVAQGGTATLLASALEEGERLELVDRVRHPKFDEKLAALPPHRAQRISFHRCDTQDARTEPLLGRDYRFVHIDAGHRLEEVRADIARYGGLTGTEGILCLDDVFEIRWPGVTQALFELLPGMGLAPFLLANRKLYLAPPRAAGHYRRALEGVPPVLADYGALRAFAEPLMGAEVVIWKFQPRHPRLEAFAA